MPLNADHFIVLVADMARAVADYRALGFTVQERADSASHGALYRFVVLADGSYILLTAFTDPAVLARHRLAPVMQEGEGWADYSFAVASTAAVTERLAGLDAPTAGPIEVANTLADGSKWGLKLLMTGRGAGGDLALPFVVEDIAGRNHRIPAYVPHANGVADVATIRIASDRPADTAKRLSAITGAAADAGAASFEGRLSLRLGGGAIEVFDDAAPQRLGRTGGGLYELVLRGATAIPLMDLHLAHGARIRVEPR